MIFENELTAIVAESIQALYGVEINVSQITLQKTKDDFEGDLTLVVFPLTKISKKSPEDTANQIGGHLKEKHGSFITGYQVVKGFLNFSIGDDSWLQRFKEAVADTSFGIMKMDESQPPVLVEYSSPNTNKPLHLGHIRNNLLGWSVAELLKAVGKKVIKVNIVNDRGVHICKSMLAWQKFGNGETPQSSGMKGDHLVGKYYVEFDKHYKNEIQTINDMASNLISQSAKYRADYTEEHYSEFLKSSLLQLIEFYRIRIYEKAKAVNLTEEQINLIKNHHFKDWIDKIDFSNQVRTELIDYHNNLIDRLIILKINLSNEEGTKKSIAEFYKDASPLLLEVQQMLRMWEAGDEEVVALWKKMNGWVYEGFDVSYKMLGVDFDKIYYESETYLLGKKIVEEGLQKNIFFKKPDGSVWIDLTSDGLDEKLVLRADGTSVYITQDLGTAQLRHSEYNFSELIFVVGNEQEYHFKVLKLILKKLGYSWADHLYHLAYAMVDLPSGKMKSREGTVVDADDLIQEMIDEAEKKTKELGKIEDFETEEARHLYKTLGLGALKYFILKVDPEKRMLFNPADSIDFNGNTGPFIQYTYARIQSVIRKAQTIAGLKNFSSFNAARYNGMDKKEKELLKLLVNFPFVVSEAALRHSPAVVANYVFEVSKSFNQFYHEHPIVDRENTDTSSFRLQLAHLVAQVIKSATHLLGIEVPERM